MKYKLEIQKRTVILVVGCSAGIHSSLSFALGIL